MPKKPAYDPKEKFVQPADGIVVISSPVLTAAQVAELEQQRLKRIRESS